MAEKYVSIKVILDRLLRNPMLEGISFESVVDYTVDFMGILGVPGTFEDKPFTDKICNYKVKLPCDFIEDIQVLINNIPARYATDTFHKSYDCSTDYIKEPHVSNYHYSNRPADSTFAIQGNYIFTSTKDGDLKMMYRAIHTDEEGYPMIPENSKFLRALEWYCKVQFYTLLWERGKLPDKVLSHTEQEYVWAVGACDTDMNKLSLSKAESFFNSFRTLIIRDTEFKNRFINNGAKELIRVK